MFSVSDVLRTVIMYLPSADTGTIQRLARQFMYSHAGKLKFKLVYYKRGNGEGVDDNQFTIPAFVDRIDAVYVDDIAANPVTWPELKDLLTALDSGSTMTEIYYAQEQGTLRFTKDITKSTITLYCESSTTSWDEDNSIEDMGSQTETINMPMKYRSLMEWYIIREAATIMRDEIMTQKAGGEYERFLRSCSVSDTITPAPPISFMRRGL